MFLDTDSFLVICNSVAEIEKVALILELKLKILSYKNPLRQNYSPKNLISNYQQKQQLILDLNQILKMKNEFLI